MASFEDRPPADPALPADPEARAAAGHHRTSHRREADDWALVLAAEGLTPKVVRDGATFAVEVDAHAAGHAARILTAWRREQREHHGHAHAHRATHAHSHGASHGHADAHAHPHGEGHPHPPLPDEPEATTLDLAAAYAIALAPLAYHAGLVASGRHAAALERGASRAARVLDGEPWRAITALTLHADAVHVAGNTLFGGFFLAALAGRLGLGCAVLAFVVTGAVGNLANAVYYGSGHGSVGASTGVFGLLGVLVGFAAWRRHLHHRAHRGAWVPLAAGLAIVGLLGGPGPRVDFSAHLFGLGAGAAAGVLLSIPLARRPRPGPRVQLVAGLAAAGLIAGAWQLA